VTAPLQPLAAVGSGVSDGIVFWTLGPLMVLAALGLLFAPKAVHAALSMAVVMVSLGGVYVALQAPFLGMVQVFVYTGAVMMLFLFVLMLVGVDSSDSLVETIRGQRVAGGLAAAAFLAFVLVALGRTTFDAPVGLDAVNADGNITGIAALIFSRYVWAFEMTAALLMVAALGAMVLAHRERTGERATQRSISENRLRRGQRMTPLPPPGVFARHNAVDTPALLPDGSPSELSVSRVLAARGQDAGHRQLAGAAVGQQGGGVDRVVAGEHAGRGQRGHPLAAPETVLGDAPLGGPLPRALAVRQHHRAQGRHHEQGGRHLEGPDVPAEDQRGDPCDVAVGVDRVETDGGVERGPAERDEHEGEERGRGQPARHPLAADGLHQGVGGVDADEHEHEQEQHHHGAGVDEDLDHAQERRLEGDVDPTEADHDHGHAQRGVDGLGCEQQAERSEHHERAERPEHDAVADAGPHRGQGLQRCGHAVAPDVGSVFCSSAHRRCASVGPVISLR